MAVITKKILAVILSVLIISGAFIIGAGAYDANERVACFNSDNTELVCIAHRGDWHSYPENSAEAISAAAEYGVISVDIKLTSDGKAVLMADDTTDRMCVDGAGKTVSGSVSDYSLAELKDMFLRPANGTQKNGKTDFHPASLEDALNAAGSSAALMLNLKCSDFEAVYSAVKSLNALENVIFRFSDKNKAILQAAGSHKDISVCGNYQGNIIFAATDTVKKCFANNIKTVEMGSKNGHGVLYDNLLMKRFDSSGKAMVSMVGGRCGKRTDNEEGWDDLITRGYSVIETDYPKELNEYIGEVNKERDELDRYLSLYGNTDTAPFTTDTEKAFTSAVAEGKRVLSQSASLSELENARFSLQSAYDNLTFGAKKAVTLTFEPTIGRILAFVLCGGAILVSQILLYKQREKKKTDKDETKAGSKKDKKKS